MNNLGFQSGKTQAIDLDELKVASANRPSETRPRGEFELDKWGDDPWTSTEDGRRRRRWAEDERWAGDDSDNVPQKAANWDVNEEELKAGWAAPKRGDVLEASEGWDDWGSFGGAPKQLEQEMESKERGGFRRVQAASQYVVADTNNYVDGQANRDDIYRQKEAYGSAGLKERRGDPYSSMPSQRPVMQAPAPEMTPIGEWDDPVDFGKSVNQQEMEDDMRASARISNLAQSGDDIPGVTRASIIIFQAETEPVVFELKKLVTTIGRGLDNMVIVNDQYTSRRHISLKYTSGKFELIAMSRDNLTSVNGHPAEHVILRHEDQIEIGATRIKFVVGPISDIHMMLGAPKNGVPAHMGQAPVRVRSPQTTRKNLIILISSVATIVVLMIVGLVLMILQKGSDSSGPKVDGRSAVAVIEEKGEVRHVAVVPMDDGLKLADDDNFLVEALMESVGLGAGHHRGTGGTVIGSRTKFSVSTTPVGARIYNADGSLRGTTPYHVEERVNGPREEQWTIRMDGYQDVVAQVNIDQGADLKFDLMPDVVEAPKPKPAPRPAAPRPKPKPKEPEKPAPGGGRRILL